MMAERPEKFNMDEMRNYFSLVDNLSVDVSDKLIADIKSDIENKILNSNIRLKTEDCKEFFDVDIDYKNKIVTWKNTDKFTFGRAVLYFKKLISVSTSGRGINSLRQSVLCFGKAATNDPATSNANIEYINKLCDDAGILLISPSTAEPVATASASTLPSRQERIANPTNKDDVLPKAPKAKQADKAKAAAPIRTDAPKAPAQEPQQIQEPMQDIADDNADMPTVLIPDSIFDCIEIIPKKYILDGIIEAGSIVMIAGKEKIGKTYALQHLALCMAAELPWLGYETMQDDKGGVLWVNLDMKRETARRRTNEISNGLCEFLTQPYRPEMFANFHMIHSKTFRDQGYDSLTFDGNADKTIAEMEKLIKDKRYNIKVCFIDSLIEIVGDLDENKSGDIGKMFRRIYQLRDETGCAFILVHHNTKGGDRGRGSSAIFSSTELNLQLSEDVNNDDKLLLSTDGARDTAKNDIGMLKVWKPRLNDDGTELKDDNGHTVWNFYLEPVDSKNISTSATEKAYKKQQESDKRYEDAVLKALEGEFEGLSKNGITAKAHIDNQESRRAVNRLYDRNEIIYLPNGKYKLP